MAAAATATAAAAKKGRVALVTGANKGIGLAIVKALATADPALTVLLGARDAGRGQTAVAELKLPNVHAFALDVDDAGSVAAGAAQLKQTYGGLDVLVNNAGIAWKGDAFDGTVARGTLRTNYYGVRAMHEHWFPLLRPGARVVNLSSMMAKKTLTNLPSAAKRAAFLAPDLTLAQLDALVESFVADVADGSWEAKGWPKSAYGISKVACSMLTRIAARDYPARADAQPDVLINCCCPGWVRTDMAGPKAPLTVEEGAVTPVFLATLPAGTSAKAHHGLFWQNKAVSSWVDEAAPAAAAAAAKK